MTRDNSREDLSQHIVSAFDEDMRTITSKISEMGGLVEEQLANVIEAVARRDDGLAGQVIERDREVDQRDAELERLAIRLLALRQPMAVDLRETIAALKISSTLERIGDLAKNVGRRSRMLTRKPALPVVTPVARMGRQVLAQLNDALDAYSARDTTLAMSVWRRDVEVDELYNSLFRELVTYMMEDPRTIGLCSQLMFVVKNFERIGDHATFIAEMTYFVVEGKPFPDERPKGEALDQLPDLGG